MELTTGHRIEGVRGRLDGELSARLVEFWTSHGVLDEAAARARLPEVVCLLLDAEGAIAGVNSVYGAEAPMVGRRMWIYRSFTAPEADDEVRAAMIRAAYEELGREFEGGERDPLGICVLVRDRSVIERHREAIWPDTGLLYAGYTDDDAQVRIRYFEDARV